MAPAFGKACPADSCKMVRQDAGECIPSSLRDFGPISMLRAIYMTPEWARVRMRLHLALGIDATNEPNPTLEAIGTFRLGERERDSVK